MNKEGGRRGEEGRGGSPGSAQPLITQEAHPLGAAAAAAAAADAVTGGSSTPAFILRGTLQIQPTSLPGRGSHADTRRRCGSTNRRHLTVRRGARRGAGRPPASAEGRL